MTAGFSMSWAITVVTCLLAASPWVGGCVMNPETGKTDVILISRDQEIAMGLEAAPQFETEFGGRVPNEALQAYVRSVGAKVASTSKRQMPYDFTLVASKDINAFALPGGKIFITAGLFSKLSNERQLAGVLGHECGHVALQHNIKGMQEQMGASVLADLAGKVAGADKAEAAKTAAKVVGSMATLKYSRTYEYEADGMGVEYLSRAGYSPWGMVEVLQVLAGLSDKKVGWLEEKFQTHPDTGSRIKEAEGKVKRISQASPTAADPNADKFMEMRKLLTPSMMK